MQIIYTSRRKFLQTSVVFCIYATSLLSKITTKTSSESKNIKNIPYLCNMCRNKCSGFARVEEKIIVKLNPNKFFPKSRNMLCPKGNAGIQAVYDKDRLKYPLIRMGKRGDGRYRKVTWDEAYEYIKEKMVKILDKQKDNRSTIAYCNGEGFNKNEFISFFGTKLGSNNFLDEGSICLNTKLGAEVLTLGDTTQPDMAGSDYIIISGANRYESFITPDSIDLLKNNSKKLIVLDPRATVTALKADIFLPINPGTDLAFCLSIIYIALKNKLYNKKFVDTYFIDFKKFRKSILSNKYTSKWAEMKTSVPAHRIKQIAEEFFSSNNPLYYLGRRSVWADNDFQLRRAMILINALAGSINKKGGLIFGKPFEIPKEELNEPFYNNSQSRFDLDGIVYGSQKGGSWLNFRDKVVNKTAPYPIKAIFIRKHNIMQNMPNIKKTRKMLDMLDLVVTIDTMPSDTVLMSDVVLPECTYLEREDLVVAFNRLEPSLALRNQTIEPLYDSRSMQDILKGLANKLSKPLFEVSIKYDKELQESIAEKGKNLAFIEGGYELNELYKNNIANRNKNIIIKNFGIDVYKTLKTNGVWFPHIKKLKKISSNYYSYYPEDMKYYKVNKKFKVKCYLKKLYKNGFDGIPIWRDKYNFNLKNNHLRLITGRYVSNTQSATANNNILKDIQSENYAWINKNVALKLSIKQGDLLEVISSIGKVKIKAYPTNKIHPKVIWFSHGFGIKNRDLNNAYGIGASDNEIIEDRFEKIYGCATMHHTDVIIRKV